MQTMQGNLPIQIIPKKGGGRGKLFSCTEREEERSKERERINTDAISRRCCRVLTLILTSICFTNQVAAQLDIYVLYRLVPGGRNKGRKRKIWEEYIVELRDTGID